jgi:hypothetical protein
MEYPLGVTMLKSILSSDRHDGKNHLRGTLIDMESRHVYKWKMRLETFKVGSKIPG